VILPPKENHLWNQDIFLPFSCKATSSIPFYNPLALKRTQGTLFLYLKAQNWKETKVWYELQYLDLIIFSPKKWRHHCPWKVSGLKKYFLLPLCLRCFHPPLLRLSIYWGLLQLIRIKKETKRSLSETLWMILKKRKWESWVGTMKLVEETWPLSNSLLTLSTNLK